MKHLLLVLLLLTAVAVVINVAFPPFHKYTELEKVQIANSVYDSLRVYADELEHMIQQRTTKDKMLYLRARAVSIRNVVIATGLGNPALDHCNRLIALIDRCMIDAFSYRVSLHLPPNKGLFFIVIRYKNI